MIKQFLKERNINIKDLLTNVLGQDSLKRYVAYKAFNYSLLFYFLLFFYELLYKILLLPEINFWSLFYIPASLIGLSGGILGVSMFEYFSKLNK